MTGRLALWAVLLAVPAGPALAQTLSLDLGQGGGVAERALQLIAVIFVEEQPFERHCESGG